jgi:hypothetical protein
VMEFVTRAKERHLIYGPSLLIAETAWRICARAYAQRVRSLCWRSFWNAYQTTVLEQFYPGEALIVGGTLGLVPYMFIRGLAARFARLLKPRRNGL